ncbi:MAG: 3-hydroxyacyl-CoA dehydrogenase family protein [Pirellulales bacterium]
MPPIKTIAVCGIGQMGAAAAVSYQRAGYDVLLWARNAEKLQAVQETLDRLNAWIDEHVGASSRKAGVVHLEPNLVNIDGQADLVMDCIAEDMEQKAILLRRFERSLANGAIFISTTSGLSITEMGRRSGVGHLLAGAHFWNPPHLMPLVEVIRGEQTPNWLMDRVCEIVEDIGKIAVRVERDVPGFIGNRLLHAMWREAIHLVETGVATAADIDRVTRLTFSLRQPAVGPFENMDLVGLELVHAIQSYLFADLANDREPQRPVVERLRAGDFGMKSGRGFYDWQARSADDLLERRDRQIVRQLDFLREMRAL